MGFEQGFDMFSIINMLFPLFFIIILGILLFTIFKNIKQWNYNNKQPKLNVDALVVSKRTQVRGGGNNSHASTSYFVTFQVESGDRMELVVNGSEYGMLAEGDFGELIFQGTRYLGFTRKLQVN
ncbi:DUF2500 domain-containing protein [Neobacillus sp. CF12]|uniref:DUF2500 domain-containing protein n=1 Tax=Neobacillus sp. CF12 TaxID=3055864 RepID=UPI0025A2D427|nr:DUF2500 domain-containing protein [Neobacillus sp. CF12]MDM5326568.1 DUF2500 domain-containing protein [Neobacillus sp. CF12]